MANTIDAKIDNADGILQGKFRWYCYGTGDARSCDYYLEYAPY